MAITFNNIPTTVRTPGVYVEIDNSRALQGLVANPHKALIIGQRTSSGTVDCDVLMAITRDNLADGYFGVGSVTARMCNIFKRNNPYTELYAMAISATAASTQASAIISFSTAMNSSDGVSGAGTYYLMINGSRCEIAITSNMSAESIAADLASIINSMDNLPVQAAASNGQLNISALQGGTLGNYINIRANYYTGESDPTFFSTHPVIISMAGGAVDPDLGDAWGVIENEQFHYIIQPWIVPANLTEIETELETRFGPLENMQGHGFTAVRGNQTSCTTLGNMRNSPFNTIMGMDDSPTCPEEWAAALGAQAAWSLNNDPARPLHTLRLVGVLPPPIENRFTYTERGLLLYDGIATYYVDSGGAVRIERCITTYQRDALGVADPSYLDVQTLATLSEIRYQFQARMSTRFISPRYKLADDTFPVQPGSYIVTPSIIKQETIALFSLLRDKGLIENLDDFVDNLIVERDSTDVNRVNILLPPDLVNQFRVLAGVIQFLL